MTSLLFTGIVLIMTSTVNSTTEEIFLSSQSSYNSSNCVSCDKTHSTWSDKNIFETDDARTRKKQNATQVGTNFKELTTHKITEKIYQYSTSPRKSIESNITVSSDFIKIDQDMLWPVKKEAVVEGDFVIGGLMMVHEREDTITCGPIMPQGGIQALEAMLYTLDQINSEKNSLLPNVTLGAHILDDCDKDTYGLEIAVDFIKGK